MMTDALRSQLARSLAETGDHIRAVPYSTVSFAAFKACDGAAWRTYELGELRATDHPEALTEALTRFALNHKDRLVIRETGAKGIRLHVYTVRRASRGQRVHRDHVTRVMHQHYLDHLVTIDGGVLI